MTATLRNFTPLFLDKEIVSFVLRSLDYLRNNKGLKIYAYVVMPEHIHFIGSCKGKITTIVGDFKRFTSREIARYMEINNPMLFEKVKADAYKGQNYAIWQETFRSEVIYEKKFLEQKINYTHNNPVRRGLVANAGDWTYSSFNQIMSDNHSGTELFIDVMVSV